MGKKSNKKQLQQAVAVSVEPVVPVAPPEITPPPIQTPPEVASEWKPGLPHKLGKTSQDFLLILRSDEIVGTACDSEWNNYSDQEALQIICDSVRESGLKLNGFQFIRRARLIHRVHKAATKQLTQKADVASK